LLFAGSAIAQDIDEVLGSYVIFKSNNSANHEDGFITLMRTAEGTGPNPDTLGVSFVSNRSSGKGNGMTCSEAVILPGNSGLTCTKEVRNPAGKIIHVETLTVAVTGSAYCDALKDTLPGSQKDNVVDETDGDCDDDNEQCICYDVRWRGNSPASPPSQGTGSGRLP
jgi:hypothetical protein